MFFLCRDFVRKVVMVAGISGVLVEENCYLILILRICSYVCMV